MSGAGSTTECNVVQLGPSTSMQGGPSRRFGKVAKYMPPNIAVTHIPTIDQYTYYGRTDGGSMLRQGRVYLAAVGRVAWAVLRKKTDVYHVHVSQRGSIIRKGTICLLLRVTGQKYIVHPHACDEEMFHRWLPKWARRLMLWGLAGASEILVLTEQWRDYYAAIFERPSADIRLFPNPVEIPPLKRDRRQPVQSILFLGRIGERKGAFHLIRAFALLRPETRSRVRLTLAGDGEVEEAKKLAESLGVAASVSLPGWVQEDQVASLLSEADAFVLPSRGEGMSNALLEALSWGLPIVATTAGGSDTFLCHGINCLMVGYGDAGGIGAALAKLIEDDDCRALLGQGARETALRYDIRDYVNRLADIYRSLTKSDGRRQSQDDEMSGGNVTGGRSEGNRRSGNDIQCRSR